MDSGPYSVLPVYKIWK